MPENKLRRRYTTKELAALWGCSQRKLILDRTTGTGCPFIRVGKSVLYREEDILAYEEANRFNSCAEARRAA